MKVTPLEHLRYLVESEQNPEVQYLVDLLVGKCSCPNFAYRMKPPAMCKHLKIAMMQFAQDTLKQIRQHPTQVKALANEE